MYLFFKSKNYGKDSSFLFGSQLDVGRSLVLKVSEAGAHRPTGAPLWPTRVAVVEEEGLRRMEMNRHLFLESRVGLHGSGGLVCTPTI